MYKSFLLFASIVLLLGTGCREQYLPDIVAEAPNFLVIEGVLNAGQGGTAVRITRTTKVDRANAIVGEANALVTVEGKDNSTVSLSYQGNGVYVHPDLNMVTDNEYRLRVRTSDGKEYLSEYVIAKVTPAIDSISWQRTVDRGINFYVNSHDDAGKTRYYRWEYDETWEIRSTFFSKYVYENASVRTRVLPAEDVSVCWKNTSSTRIMLSSTARLESDQVSMYPLTGFPMGDDRLSFRYSILVRQYALTKEAYEFYDLLRKNTESIGTIFDAQPSEVRGNITCINDPEEPVLGFVTASSVQEKRIFVSSGDVPDWRYFQDCESKLVTLDSVSYYFGIGGYKPFDANINPLTNRVESYMGSYDYCVDCRDRKGTTTRPSFW